MSMSALECEHGFFGRNGSQHFPGRSWELGGGWFRSVTALVSLAWNLHPERLSPGETSSSFFRGFSAGKSTPTFWMNWMKYRILPPPENTKKKGGWGGGKQWLHHYHNYTRAGHKSQITGILFSSHLKYDFVNHSQNSKCQSYLGSSES